MNIVNGVEQGTNIRLDNPISRRFVELSADVNGPTLVRIWDAPNSTYAQRFRHSIEPFAQVMYRTAIDNYNAIPKLESHGQHRRKRHFVQIRYEHALLREAHGRRAAGNSA